MNLIRWSVEQLGDRSLGFVLHLYGVVLVFGLVHTAWMLHEMTYTWVHLLADLIATPMLAWILVQLVGERKRRAIRRALSS